MAKHDDISASSIDNPDVEWVANSIEEAMRPPLSSARIPRVLKILVSKGKDAYEEYYVPKVVSIGPYHYGNQKLELVEKLKPVFTKALLLKYSVGLRTLSKRLREVSMVQELRKFYEDESTEKFSDKEFTRMMLLDGCFILYYILFIFGEKAGSCPELRSHQIVSIRQDLFLLENQIPFKAVNEVMKLIKLDRREHDKIELFFNDNILVPVKPKRRDWFGCGSGSNGPKRRYCWFGCGSGSNENDEYSGQESEENLTFHADDHLLHHLHSTLTRTKNTSVMVPKGGTKIEQDKISNRSTFRNAKELLEVGIHFKQSSFMSLAHVEFVGRRWGWFSADIELPPISVDDSTKTMLLNLIAYEMCADEEHSWVTAYVCLLASLIDHPEDVKVLREAGVLDNYLGSRSDKEVLILLKEISTDLVPNALAYLKAKNQMQRQYDSMKNTMYAKFKHEYLKQWSVLALLGAVMALFLNAVQTYFTVWDQKDECDDLCTFLKMNHRL